MPKIPLFPLFIVLSLLPALTEAATIKGVVRELADSTFVSGAKVVLLTGTTRLDSTTTDSVGAYSLLNVTTGNKNVTVSAAGLVSVTNAVNITTAGQTATSNFLIGLPASLAGKVRKITDSTALAGASVYLRRTSGTSAILDSTVSDASGNYAFAGVAPGTPNYWITAGLATYLANTNANVTVGSGAAVVSNVYLTAVMPGGILGKVRRSGDSVAIAGAKLLLRRGNSDTSAVLDSAVSDASGNYAFSNLAAGFTNYRIATTAAGYAAGSNTNITVNNGANTALNISLVTLGHVTGRVRKQSDSTSLKNALVLLRRGTTDTSAVLDSARTDSLGAYTFVNLTAANNYRAYASLAGYVSITNTGITVANGGTATSNFFLGQPATLSGKTRKSTDSTALAGVSVYLRRTSATSAILDSTVSDASGSYAFANVAPSTPNYWITGSRADYLTTTNANVAVASAAAVTSNLYLVPVLPGSISGKVRKATDSTAITGARLLLRRGNSDTSAVLDSALSDVSGNYAFNNLTAGFTNYRIATTFAGYAAGSNTNITVNNGANTALNISLVALGRITGRVRKLSDSTSLKNALVLLRRGTTDTSAVLDSARTDSLGSYTFVNLAAANNYRAYASLAGYVSITNTGVTVANAATATSNFFLGLPASLSGKVRKTADSTALKNAWVYLRRTSATSALLDSAKTDSLGNYAFANLAFGTPNYYLTAQLANYAPVTNSNIALASGASVTSNFFLDVIVPGSIAGKVRRATDTTLAIVNALVKLRRGSDTAAVIDSARTDSAGHYAFTGLAPLTPNYWISAAAPGFAPGSNTNIALPNGASVISNFSLAAGGTLNIHVKRQSDSLVLAGALVQLRRGAATTAVLDSAITDASGNCSFSNLTAANNYRVTASLHNYVTGNSTNNNVAAGGSAASNLYLAAIPLGRIAGRVLRSTDSVGLINTLLVLRRGSDTSAVVDSLRSDANGAFLFVDVQPGLPNYWVTASRLAFTTQTLGDLAVLASDTTDANFFLAVPVALRPVLAVGSQGFLAKRLGQEWAILMPTSDKARLFEVLDVRGTRRYQAAVPAGTDRIYVPSEAIPAGSLLRLR